MNSRMEIRKGWICSKVDVRKQPRVDLCGTVVMLAITDLR